MPFITHKSQVRTIKPNDPRFLIDDGIIVYPRAGFEVAKECPVEYMQIIQQCIQNGWLKPVANMTEKELIFMGLTKE